MAFVHSSDCRLSCPQTSLSWGNPYRSMLARKVENAVEKALEYEGQKKMLEDYALSRTWTMPRTCRERRLVTGKIHSLLLQWKPDFSVQWALKVRRALPFLETAFSLMACCIADYSQPLLIEPRLKKVICLLETIPSQGSASQSSSQHSLSTIFNAIQRQGLRIYSSSEHPAQAAGRSRTLKACLQGDDEEGMESKIKEGDEKPGAGLETTMVHEACIGAPTHSSSCRVDGNRSARRKPACASVCRFCMQPDSDVKIPDSKTEKGVSCKPLTVNDVDEDSFEWRKANLHSRGTVATLMASELRSSRKEGASQALVNRIGSNGDQRREESWTKQLKSESSQITDSQKRMRKKRKGDLCFKKLLHVFLHTATREKSPDNYLLLRRKGSSSRSLRSLLNIPCHTPTEVQVLPFSKTCSAKLLEASETTTCSSKPMEASDPSTCSLLCLAWKCATERNEKIDVTNSGTVEPCAAPNYDKDDHNVMGSGTKSEEVTFTCPAKDHDRDDSITLDTCPTSDVDVHLVHPESRICSDCSSAITSICGFLGESGNLGAGFACQNGIQVESSVCQTCVHGQPEASQSSRSSPGRSDDILASSQMLANDDGFCMLSGRHIQIANVSVPEDDTPEDPANGSKVKGDVRDQSFVNNADIMPRINNGEESNCSEEYEPLHPVSWGTLNKDISDRAGTPQGRIQAGILESDRVVHEVLEPCADARLDLEASKNNEASTSNMGTVQLSQWGDEERQQPVRRARVPLSSLLAQREDWTPRSPTVRKSTIVDCSWDTWEEPTEALDPLCCVCTIRLRGAAFAPCGHTFCRKCSRELWKARGTCPLCNKLIASILDIF